MNAIFLILLAVIVLLLILAVLSFFIPLVFSFTFDTVKREMLLTMRWLPPFFKAGLETEDGRLIVSVFLFSVRILSKPLKKRGKKETGYLRALKLKDTYVKTSYAFRDPFSTGIACGAAEFVRLLLNIGNFEQRPEFIASEEYIIVDAGGKVNIGATADNLIRIKISGRHSRQRERRKSYGSIGTQ